MNHRSFKRPPRDVPFAGGTRSVLRIHAPFRFRQGAQHPTNKINTGNCNYNVWFVVAGKEQV